MAVSSRGNPTWLPYLLMLVVWNRNVRVAASSRGNPTWLPYLLKLVMWNHNIWVEASSAAWGWLRPSVLWAIVICYDASWLKAFRKDNHSLYGVESLVGFTIDFTPFHLLPFGMSKSN